MATIWWLAPFITLLGWIFSPAISFYLNKKLSDIYDASKKVPHLVAHTIPDLKNALREVEEQWMLKKLSPEESYGVFTLDELESLLQSLKAALYEAEDIVDFIDYHLIDNKARGDSHNTTWLQWRCQPLCDSWLGTCVHIVGAILAALWQWMWLRLCHYWRRVRGSGSHLPTYRAHLGSPAFKNLFRVISKPFKSAKDRLDRFNKNYEQDVDSTIMGPLCTPLKENLKRIEELFDEASKCTSFTRRVQQTFEQPDQQRINGSGNTLNFTNKDEQVTADPAIKVIGRDKDLKEIRTMLHDLSSSENVIGICGIPGSGKTTLAQYVYQSEKGGGHFDLVMWIHVSKNFSMEAIFRQMFEAASPNGDGKNVCPKYSSLEALRRDLVNKLKKKRFLLVLDDIWSDESVNGKSLPRLVSPFKNGWRGSKILVTSRDESALRALGPDVSYSILPIRALDDKDFIELLMYYARVDTRYRSPLHTIGEQIAHKLKGSPLVARLVGGMLSKEHDINSWRTVLHREHLNEAEGADLWWCYQHLDENVRRCFNFCSIFPRGHHLFRDELVNLWVAEGFITRINEGDELEDAGQRYFRQLVSTSFLQPGVKAYKTDPDHYLVHDRLHDLAVEVAGSGCFRIENGLSSSWTGKLHPDVRHLFLLNYNVVVIWQILTLKKLRTLIIYAVPDCVSVEYEVIESIFLRLQRLRVLAIAFTHGTDKIKKTIFVAESVCQSKHLRYLSFRTGWKNTVSFRSTPTKLHHLWLLDVGDATRLEFSCDEFTNLRHILGEYLLEVPNVRKMISLQTLPCFFVSKEKVYKIKQLRNLNKLRGSLTISGLENVSSKAEALEANLSAKERLKELTLQFGRDIIQEVDLEVEAEVLDGLCPPMGLETLHIFDYLGSRYPNWMWGKWNGGPKYLQKLQFSQCSQPGPPPELNAFIHLQSLKISGCSWHALPGNMEDLTSLKLLLIEGCLEIRSLPTLPQSIEEFTLRLCHVEFMKSCENTDHSNWQKIKHIPKINFIFPEKYHEPQDYVITRTVNGDVLQQGMTATVISFAMV